MASVDTLTITIPEFALLLVATFGLGVGACTLFRSLGRLISSRIGLIKHKESEGTIRDPPQVNSKFFVYPYPGVLIRVSPD